jgi:hypothetical protein
LIRVVDTLAGNAARIAAVSGKAFAFHRIKGTPADFNA